ncbi:LOW QUALITY PROTEIN: centrosomal protein of 95 kDa-like [Panonychus citri]|uniref:LOW QUALITY PROTEIN: centrosomal protein of 95 kDa-like n=1 Tax=Panonychus citri TaxID=50023 RepID=UPI0023081E2A|nr:LOW QUALITY PROTEIN: centrosomal protein of 95 kDa-like [Panonychus citri]
MVKEKDCVRLLNKLAFLCDHQIISINHINQINYKIIARIFISIFNRRGVYPNLCDECLPEEQQFKKLVNFLESDILHISLDHIKPDDLIAHNPISIYNLLEILAACELYLPCDEQNQHRDEPIQLASKAFQALSLSPPLSPSPPGHSDSWSSPTNSSLSNDSTFSLSSSSSCLSLSSISSIIPTPPVIKSPSPELIPTKQFTDSPINLSRVLTKSGVSSPDSVYLLQIHGGNSEYAPKSNPQSNKSSSSSSSSPGNRFTETKGRRKVDKATNTEPEDLRKQHQESDLEKFEQRFESYEALASHRFALEIGHKLQRALRLEEATKQIEAKLCAITGELNTNVPKKHTNKSNGKRKTLLSPWKNKPMNKSVSRKSPSTASTKLNVHTKPLICSKRIERLIKSKPQQSTYRSRLKLDVNSGQGLLDEWKKQSSRLAEAQSALESQVTNCPNSHRLRHIRERSLIRDARTERARVHRLICDLERKTCSKYLTVQAKEQQLIKSQTQEKIKSFRDDLINYKDLVKSQMDKEQEKRKRLLDAFTNYYQQQLTLIKDKLDQEENDLTARYKYSTITYNKLRRELKSKLEKEIDSLISSQ